MFVPDQIHAMRRATANQKPMAGVTSPSFFCPKCKTEKRVTGRKQRVKGSSKFGYVCGDCAK